MYDGSMPFLQPDADLFHSPLRLYQRDLQQPTEFVDLLVSGFVLCAVHRSLTSSTLIVLRSCSPTRVVAPASNCKSAELSSSYTWADFSIAYTKLTTVCQYPSKEATLTVNHVWNPARQPRSKQRPTVAGAYINDHFKAPWATLGPSSTFFTHPFSLRWSRTRL